jgi:GNAT superfamily N-acetyltransferase
VTDLRALVGPLAEEQLGWVAATYGAVDPRYAALPYLRHQLNENPVAPSLHVFAVEQGAPVGHCCVVPLPAQLGGRRVVAGKFEALVLAPSQRGGTLATELLEALVALAHANGVDVLFAFVRPSVVRAFVRAGCWTAEPDASTYVLFSDPAAAGDGWPLRRRLAARGLAVLQNAVLAPFPVHARIESPNAADARLVAAAPGTGQWTVLPAEAWDWLVGSDLLQAVEIPGSHGGRALVRRGDRGGAGLQLVAWAPHRGGALARLRLLAALRRLARAQGAPTLRVQPWGGGVDAALARTCRRLGFVRRAADPLPVHSRDEAFRDADVLVNPFFHATF